MKFLVNHPLAPVAALLFAFAISPLPANAAPAEEATPTFDVLEYDIQGNTRLTDSEIERAVTPFLGEDKTLTDVEAARQALERAYHDAGYLTVVVSIPNQKVDDGNVILDVVEATVGRMRVKGSEYHQLSAIKAQVPELAEGNVPYFPNVQRQLETVNRNADLKVTPVLKAGRLPGTVDVDLDADDQLPLHGNLELSNRNSPYTVPLRLSGSIHYDNLWQLGHSISFTAQTAPQATEQATNLSATYVMPVGRRGDVLALYAVHTSSNVPSYPTGVLGNSDIFGLRYALLLPNTPDYSQSLSLGIDRKHIKQSLVLGSSGGPTTETPDLTYTPLVASYTGTLLGKSGSTSFNAMLTLGMRGLLDNQDSTFAAKRNGASADFTALRLGVQQVETFSNWTVSGKVEVQFASGPLVPNEQYAAGGAESVRGYKESERLGDEALRLALEVRTPSVSLGTPGLPLRVAGVGFAEGVTLRTLQPVYPQARYERMRGAGVGLRISGPSSMALDLNLAHAFDDGQTTRAGDFRLDSRLTWDF